MRRSGITSRSKCANFSSSQISCSSAGPRGPAVMMLKLSLTGAPLAWVRCLGVGCWGLLLSVMMRVLVLERAISFGGDGRHSQGREMSGGRAGVT
jgi:hypothetical protein